MQISYNPNVPAPAVLNEIKYYIGTVGADALYDESVKRLLAHKSILAVILKECVPEFQHCTTREIAERYIEGEPQIGQVGVAPR